MPKTIRYEFLIIDSPQDHPTWFHVLITKYVDNEVVEWYNVLLDGRKSCRDCTCPGWYYRGYCKHGDMVREWIKEYRPLEVT